MFCFHGNGQQQTSEITFFAMQEQQHICWFEKQVVTVKRKKSICTVVSGLTQTTNNNTSIVLGS